MEEEHGHQDSSKDNVFQFHTAPDNQRDIPSVALWEGYSHIHDFPLLSFVISIIVSEGHQDQNKLTQHR